MGRMVPSDCTVLSVPEDSTAEIAHPKLYRGAGEMRIILEALLPR